MMRFGGGFAPHMTRGFGYGYGLGPGAIIAPIVCFLLVAGLVALLVAAIVRVRHGHGYTAAAPAAPFPVTAPVDQASTIVRERLARGEIDAQEYQRLMSALNGPN